MNEQNPPVKAGEEHEVLIESVGEKGDGIARVKGFVLFIPKTKKGDYVKVKITKVLPKVGFAEVVEHKEKPVREQKYTTFTREEMNAPVESSHSHIEDTDNFGE